MLEGLGRMTRTAADAAPVRWEIRPASSSAAAAIRVSMNFPAGPGGRDGRLRKATPASPEPSATESRNRAFRARRPILATARAAARAGRPFRFPDSTSWNSAISLPPWRAAMKTAAALAPGVEAEAAPALARGKSHNRDIRLSHYGATNGTPGGWIHAVSY